MGFKVQPCRASTVMEETGSGHQGEVGRRSYGFALKGQDLSADWVMVLCGQMGMKGMRESQ